MKEPIKVTNPVKPAVLPPLAGGGARRAEGGLVNEVSLQSVMRRLFKGEWDGRSEPTGLTAAEKRRLAEWRSTSGLVLPILGGSTFPMPWSWAMAVGAMTEEVSDIVLKRGLRVAAHGFLRDVQRAAASSKTAARLGENASLTVLREVIAFSIHKTEVGAATLAVWDDYDLSIQPGNRRAPGPGSRARWAREARMARFAEALKYKDLDKTTRRRAELDAGKMIATLGLTPTTAEVDGWLAGQEQARRFRWAWQLYADHCAGSRDLTRPGRATQGKEGRPSLADRVLPPPEVCAAIKLLLAKFTVTGLHKLRVSDYRGERAIWVTTSRGRTAVPLTIEEHGAVEVVRAWAGNRGEAALVPRKAGEAGAMSVAGMRRVAGTTSVQRPPTTGATG